AALIAPASLVLPSPLAPNAFTLNVAAWAGAATRSAANVHEARPRDRSVRVSLSDMGFSFASDWETSRNRAGSTLPTRWSSCQVVRPPYYLARAGHTPT